MRSRTLALPLGIIIRLVELTNLNPFSLGHLRYFGQGGDIQGAKLKPPGTAAFTQIGQNFRAHLASWSCKSVGGQSGQLTGPVAARRRYPRGKAIQGFRGRGSLNSPRVQDLSLPESFCQSAVQILRIGSHWRRSVRSHVASLPGCYFQVGGLHTSAVRRFSAGYRCQSQRVPLGKDLIFRQRSLRGSTKRILSL